MQKYEVAVVTTSRADYGLLSPLLVKLREDKHFSLRLIVTGSHLSSSHGLTSQYIIEDGIDISDIVDMSDFTDSSDGICRSIAAGFEGFSQIYSTHTIDAVIVLGDRFELIPACFSALIHRIPIAHIHGGEVTMGAWDEGIRHSITKLAALHFPSIEEYAKRIIQMGEEPERVHVVGALGIDNINNVSLMTESELKEYVGYDFKNNFAIMTYHPVTLDDDYLAAGQTRAILDALLRTDLFTIITMPNADSGSSSITEVIQKYVEFYPSKFVLFKSLGQKAYLSAMQYAGLMIGNSSSGIIESSSFRLPVVNIGDRQAGRFKPENVIDCECTVEDIGRAIKRALSEEFLSGISDLSNPYGDGKTADRIIEILKKTDLKNKSGMLKKKFFDIRFNYK